MASRPASRHQGRSRCSRPSPATSRQASKVAIAGVTAAVVPVILAIALTLAPAAATDPTTLLIATMSAVAVLVAKRDVALVAAAAIVAGVALAVVRAL